MGAGPQVPKKGQDKTEWDPGPQICIRLHSHAFLIAGRTPLVDEINLGLSFRFLSFQLGDFGQVSHPLRTAFSPSIKWGTITWLVLVRLSVNLWLRGPQKLGPSELNQYLNSSCLFLEDSEGLFKEPFASVCDHYSLCLTTLASTLQLCAYSGMHAGHCGVMLIAPTFSFVSLTYILPIFMWHLKSLPWE